jgi:simple sugar transport system permease protein
VNETTSGSLLVAVAMAALRYFTPVVLTALGGVVSERAGVVNIGLESMMLTGAYVAVATAQATGSVFVGVIAGVVAGALVGLLHAFFTQTLRVPHILSGVGLNLGALGLTTYALRQAEANGRMLTSPAPLSFPALMVVAIALVIVVWFVLARTPLGLRLVACGENPEAARAAGVNVARVRYGAVITSGALAGLGGAALALAGLGAFTENMTAGRGYIALAAVIFGRWNPLGAAGAVLFFSLGVAGEITLQTLGLSRIIPPDFLTLLPYVLTLVALAGITGRASAPAALGRTDDA